MSAKSPGMTAHSIAGLAAGESPAPSSGNIRRMRQTALLLVVLATSLTAAQGPQQPNWTAIEEETLRHFQAMVQMDTTDPPGTPKRGPPPPFSAERNGGYIYGRGTVDDKDTLVGMLMTMVMLKRQNVPLDRDVIFLAEAGEEGATRIGIQFMVNQHFDAIDAEYCYAEGGNVTRVNGGVKYASVQTVEKIPRAIKITAKGTAGHGSVPLEDNAVAHLGEAVGAIAQWTPPTRLNETTATYFKRLAQVSSPEEAARYRDALSPDPAVSGPAQQYLRKNEPRHWSMLRTSLSPTIIQGGYRSNVIPSEATANIDVRQV